MERAIQKNYIGQALFYSFKKPNLKSEKPFGFRNGITISD
jgi:hypothetical protein